MIEGFETSCLTLLFNNKPRLQSVCALRILHREFYNNQIIHFGSLTFNLQLNQKGWMFYYYYYALHNYILIYAIIILYNWQCSRFLFFSHWNFTHHMRVIESSLFSFKIPLWFYYFTVCKLYISIQHLNNLPQKSVFISIKWFCSEFKCFI